MDAFHRLKEYGGLSVELLFDKLGRTSQFQPLLVFDVGANTGLSTEMILKWTAAVHGPSRALTTIHSFEPNKLGRFRIIILTEHPLAQVTPARSRTPVLPVPRQSSVIAWTTTKPSSRWSFHMASAPSATVLHGPHQPAEKSSRMTCP